MLNSSVSGSFKQSKWRAIFLLKIQSENVDTVRSMSSIRLLTIREISQILKMSTQTIYKMIESGQIPAIKIGAQWRFDEEKILEWIRQHETNMPTHRD